ncbi:MAG: TraX protein [Clostridia bacterium]|nr:TraX protein [Clostridia bacterium]
MLQDKLGISAAGLKWLAMLTMLIDHIGAVFVTGPWYIWMRMIGRMAFPIYCFLLAEGAVHSHSRLKYALRLLLCAVVTEPIFDYTLHDGWFKSGHQNVLWTLLFALLAIMIGDFRSRKWRSPLLSWGGRILSLLLKVLALLSMMKLAEWMNTDYGGYGVAMAVCFYWLHRVRWLSWLTAGALTWLKGGLQIYAVWALAPIALYNGRKGRSSRWFYLFYPAHLAVLGLAAYIVGV